MWFCHALNRIMTDKPSAAVSLSPTGDPWLLTPGPLTTSPSVKQASVHDFGSRDTDFIALNRSIRNRLVQIVNGGEMIECVPLQGSGTFVVEAMLSTFVGAAGRIHILVNGAYGKRMESICRIHGYSVDTTETPEDVPVDPAALDLLLRENPSITHVAVVHCETTSGILNPIKEIADVVAKHNRRLLIDAMSAFGAIELDATQVRFDAVVASSNKCLQGVPGMGFCLARRDALTETEGRADTLTLDLFDQWVAMEKNGQWRFTPPTHCMVSLNQALDEFDTEGGVAGRGARYRENYRILVDGMRELGFQPLLEPHIQAPIIVTFHTPRDPAFEFQTFYDRLRQRGFVIYPGKLTVADSFRIGCIGDLNPDVMREALDAIASTLSEMGVADCAPAST